MAFGAVSGEEEGEGKVLNLFFFPSLSDSAAGDLFSYVREITE